jgi:hypothetical protein
MLCAFVCPYDCHNKQQCYIKWWLFWIKEMQCVYCAVLADLYVRVSKIMTSDYACKPILYIRKDLLQAYAAS